MTRGDAHTHTPAVSHTHQLLQSWSLSGSKVSWQALSFQEAALLISLAELNVNEKEGKYFFFSLQKLLDWG